MATAVGTGLDNLGSLCSQAGLDRWELLGLAVLSALTVYRKELSSNSVYHGRRGRHRRGDAKSSSPAFQHAEGCPGAEVDGGSGGGRPCACVEGAQRAAAAAVAAAAAASVPASAVDQHRLRRLVEGRMRSLNLPVKHLKQLRASVDASWASFAAAWEAGRGAKGGNGGKSRAGEKAASVAASVDFVMPPCSHSPRAPSAWVRLGRRKGASGDRALECMECAALKAAHAAAASILRKGDTSIMTRSDPIDAWASTMLGALPAVSLQKTLGFLQPKDLLVVAQVSKHAREAADEDWVWREAWISRFGELWKSDKCQHAASRWHLHDWDPRNASVKQVGAALSRETSPCRIGIRRVRSAESVVESLVVGRPWDTARGMYLMS